MIDRLEVALFLIESILHRKNALGGGTVLDLGIYGIQFSQWIFGTKPATINASGKINEDGCDVEMEATLTYPNGGIAQIRTSALKQLSNQAIIRGAKGTIIVRNALAKYYTI